MPPAYMLLSISAVWVSLTVLTVLAFWNVGTAPTVAELLYATERRV
jgi:hypothetical protein